MSNKILDRVLLPEIKDHEPNNIITLRCDKKCLLSSSILSVFISEYLRVDLVQVILRHRATSLIRNIAKFENLFYIISCDYLQQIERTALTT
jgi:hypothetical protein